MSESDSCRVCGAPLGHLVHGACAYCGTPVDVDQDVAASAFSVVMVAAGNRRLQVINALYEQSGCTVPEAMRVADAVAEGPQVLATDLQPGAARRLAKALRSVGADVEVHAPPPPPLPPREMSGMYAVVLHKPGRKQGRIGAALMAYSKISNDEQAWIVTHASEGTAQIAGFFPDEASARQLLERLLELDAEAELRQV